MATKYHFDQAMQITPELCEFIGAFIGDGFTNKYNKSYIVQITGDAKLDREYFDNTIRLTVCSKELYELLTKRFNFNTENKTYAVEIPEEMIKSKNNECLNIANDISI